MGRHKILPFKDESCINCDMCVYDKRTSEEICVWNFEKIVAKKHHRCKRYRNEDKKAWRKKG